jgi:recombinational DNA repair protein (RecF pathway)
MPYNREQKDLMRRAQFNRCARCGKPLGADAEGHAKFRGEHDHDYWLQGELLCPECHKETRSYGQRRPDPRDPFGR